MRAAPTGLSGEDRMQSEDGASGWGTAQAKVWQKQKGANPLLGGVQDTVSQSQHSSVLSKHSEIHL